MAHGYGRSTCHWPCMIVFNHQNVSIGVKEFSQLTGPRFIEGSTGWVLGAWGENARRNTMFQRPGKIVRNKAKVINSHRFKSQAEGSEQIKNFVVTGIFNGNAVPGVQVSLEDALDRVEGPSHNGE